MREGWTLQFLARLVGRQRAPLVGLDIGTSGVCLVELGTSARGGWTLERFGTEPLGRGCISEGQIEDFDAVVAAVRRLLSHTAPRQRRVALALPASAVMTRRMVMPAGLRDDELEQLVRLEIEQHIPFPLDEVSLDFSVTGPLAGAGSQVEVLVAASRLERVQDRQGVAEAAGLVPIVMDIETHASLRAMQRWLVARSLAAPGALMAWFDVGQTAMRLQVLQDGSTVHEQEQGSEPQASAGERGNMLAARRIAQALQQFFASAPHHAVDHVLLSGPVAAAQGLARQVAEVTGFDTVRVDPFEGMAIGAAIDRERQQRDASACLLACGLAMRADVA
jgi:type IV pilus assembly protein PilM